MIHQLLLFIFLTTITSVVPISDDKKYLSHMTLDDTSRLEIPAHISNLKFTNVTFLSSTCELIGHTHNVEQIELDKSTTHTFCLNPSVERFHVANCNISEIVFANQIQNESFATTVINVHHTPITSIPSNISTLTKLQDLRINSANLRSLNLRALNELNNLTRLQMKECNISEVYSDVSIELPSLDEFTLPNNLIKRIDMYHWNMPRLKYLDLSYNHLSVFPPLNRFPDLVVCLLSNNFITSVNMSLVSGLDNLLKLVLSDNRILHLYTPEPVHLPLLFVIHLGRNFLQNLNVSAWNVPKLKYLVVNVNLLQRIDGIESIADSIEEIDLSGNLWSCVWLNNVTMQLKKSWKADCSP